MAPDPRSEAEAEAYAKHLEDDKRAVEGLERAIKDAVVAAARYSGYEFTVEQVGVSRRTNSPADLEFDPGSSFVLNVWLPRRR